VRFYSFGVVYAWYTCIYNMRVISMNNTINGSNNIVPNHHPSIAHKASYSMCRLI